MSQPVERSSTPAMPSTPLQESYSSTLSESSELSTLAEAIPQLDRDTSATLEERFLQRLAIQAPVGPTAQAAAVVPQHRQAAGYHLLIDLVCHRVFSSFRQQGGIRNFSVYYYGGFLPGDTLTAVSRKVFRGQLSWLEATVARDSVVVAVATALYDAASSEPEEGKRILADQLFAD